MKCKQCSSNKILAVSISINHEQYHFVTCSSCFKNTWYLKNKSVNLSDVVKEVRSHPETVSAHRPAV